MTLKDELISIVDNAFAELDKQPQRVENTDYIRRESVGDLCPKNVEIINGRLYVDMEELLNLVDGIPAADVEPVRHGRWGKKQGGFWEFAPCSLCGEKTTTVGIAPNYCPSCGAKMDSEDKTDDGTAT